MARKKKESVQPAPQINQPSAGAGRTVVVALNRVQGIDYPMPDGRIVSIAGNAEGLRGQEMGQLPVGAYGLTEIREDDWLYIEKMWGETPLFKNGLIFASTKGEKDAKAEARNREDLRNGMEPVDPERSATKPASAKDGE
jgi:hypothetical protein